MVDRMPSNFSGRLITAGSCTVATHAISISFTSLLTLGEAHGGIILAPQQRYPIGEQLRRLLKLIAAKSSEDMQNQVEFLSKWR
jgi:hypothetical protein